MERLKHGEFGASQQIRKNIMPVGKVKWFNNAKGFGFIVADNSDEDFFAHYSAIEMDGYRTLRAGQTVAFEVSKGEKGLHAINIRAHNDPTDSKAEKHELEESFE